MLTIKIAFDDDLIQEQIAIPRPGRLGMSPDISFRIYLEADGVAFPDAAWYEDGRCTLNLWGEEMNHARSSDGQGNIYFIESPFYLRFEIEDNQIVFRYQDGVMYGMDRLDEFVSELQRAMNYVKSETSRLTTLTGIEITYEPTVLLPNDTVSKHSKENF